MTTNAYWYKVGTFTHVVFANTTSIAHWYVKSMPMMKGAKFIGLDNRSATNQESHTVLAHNANKTLLESRDSWRANGGSIEYQQKLDRLAKPLT